MRDVVKEPENESDVMGVIFRVRLAIEHGLVEYGSFPTPSAAVESGYEMMRPILDFHPGSSMSEIAPKKAKNGFTFVVRASDGIVIGEFGIIARPSRIRH
jgi:hypothetical protein